MPHQNSKDLAELETSLQKAMGGQWQKQILLTNDFYRPDVERNGATVNPNAPDWQLVNLTAPAQLIQIQDDSTRENKFLDLIFSSSPSLARNTSTIQGTSDHNMIVTDMDIQPHRVKGKILSLF